MRRLVLILLALVATAAAPARAAEVSRPLPAGATASDPHAVGPVLAGDRVVWAVGTYGGDRTIRAWRPGAAPETLAVSRVPSDGQDYAHGVSLFGSPTRLVWLDTVTT